MKYFSFFISCFLAVGLFAQDLTVERIWKSGEFYGKGVDGFNSLEDGQHFTKIVENTDGSSSLQQFSFKDFNGNGVELVNLSGIQFNGKPLKISDVVLSKSGKKLLILTEQTPIYRHSYSTVYYLYDIPSKKTIKIHTGQEKQTLGTFSPDETQIGYVAENNLYVYNCVSNQVTQLTTDGKYNNIINGTTDWVYEEEFAITQGFSWSPDSKFIAYMRFDESQVKQFNMAIYGNLYPEQYTFKYPKAGEDNSKVTMHITPIAPNAAKIIDLGTYEYLPRFQWSPVNNDLVVLTLNRHQSEVKYHLISNPASPVSKVFYTETSTSYLDVDYMSFLKDGKTMLHTSEKDGWNHIYQLSFDGQQKQITSGKWDVIEVYGIDEKTKTVYYASAENGAINKTIYAINLDGSKKKALSRLEGTHNAEFSVGFQYFIRTSSTANTVNTFTLCDKTGKELQVLESNQALQQKLDAMHLSKKEFLQVPGADGTMLNAWMMKPANFDPTKKYPVYINIYCGPGSNTVSNEFEGVNYLYHQLLTQKGYIVFSVDPRGTMYRGAEFKKSTYLQLGKLETEDLIAVAKQLQKESYIDAGRIGIQGWSYGGFMTSLAMTKGADIFKMGIAVAPVTNWRNYDNIYTERFMRTPQENASGYDDNSPVNHASKLKGSFLLIHGSADDNVHYQNSMELVTALVKANKQFDMFIYPNKNHSIYGGNTRNHLFTMMLDFTLKNL